MSQRLIRRRRIGTYNVTIAAPEPARRLSRGWLPVLAGFLLAGALATALLTLPQAAEGTGRVDLLGAAFTAVSALTVSGLAVAETSREYNAFGEVVVLLLIQLGGLGYMVGASLVLWALGRRLGMRDHQMVRMYQGRPTAAESLRFARTIVLYALCVETAGAAALFVAFLALDEPAGRSAWWAVFHAVSAFNVAGFTITGAGMVPFQGEPGVLLPVAVLAVAGSIGAVPVLVGFRGIRVGRVPLDARLVFLGAGGILLLGTAFILASEWTNPETLGAVAAGKRPVLALFQASMWTGGSSAVDNAALRDQTGFFLAGMMFIGGAAGSASGGVKIGTTVLLFMTVIAAIRGRTEVTIGRRRIAAIAVRRALAFVLAMVALIFVEAVALMMVSDLPFIDVLLEATSALTTAGWSTGITGEFNAAGQLILLGGMIVGRFAPILLILEMTYPRAQPVYRLPEEGVHLG